jgi:hypothetical protein
MPRTSTRLTNTSATGVTAPKKGRGAAKKTTNPDTATVTTTEKNPTNNSAKATETNASVLALKEVYQSVYGEYSRLAEDARKKLAHLESLELVLVQPTPFNLNLPSLDLPATEVQAASTNSNNSSSYSNSLPEDSAETLVPRARKGGRPKSVPSAVATKPETTEAPKAKRGRQPKAATAKVEPETPRRRGGLKLIKPYQDSTMLDALQIALEDRKGTTVSADTLVEALYGDQLKPEQFKLAKDRVTKSLSKGKIENRWDRVPDKIGCYTISMKLLEL